MNNKVKVINAASPPKTFSASQLFLQTIKYVTKFPSGKPKLATKRIKDGIRIEPVNLCRIQCLRAGVFCAQENPAARWAAILLELKNISVSRESFRILFRQDAQDLPTASSLTLTLLRLNPSYRPNRKNNISYC